MSNTTYDVRIWKTEVRKGKKTTGHYVRWAVAGTSFRRSFRTSALATSFRSKLISASRDGIAFDVDSGLPITMLRAKTQINWIDFACDYIDMKWASSSPKHRKTIVDSLIAITIAMLNKTPASNKQKAVRSALRALFNPNTRSSASEEHLKNIEWSRKNTKAAAELSQPETLRVVLRELETKLDETKASANTVRLRRTTLTNSLDYAVEQKILNTNPMQDVQIRKTKTSLGHVDRRSVPNPQQARSLLQAVSISHPQLKAFFSLMYFAALRPEEASNLRKQDLSLPEAGWGRLYLDGASPEVGDVWTDTQTREERNLKHREDGIGRPVPCPPELTATLHDHILTYGTAPDGRLFRGKRNGSRISSSVYGRAWAKARETALADPDSTNSLLAKRPYDLRHAAVSTWLNAGVEPTRVAEWAGHSVSVLLRVYAKCLDGGEEAAQKRVQQALDDAR